MTAENKVITAVDYLVGRNISALRERRRVTQLDLGLSIGVSFQQIQKYEKGQNRVAVSRLAAIARVLEAPVAYFFQEDGAGVSAGFPHATMQLVGAGELLETYAGLAPELRQRALIALRGLSQASGRPGLAS